MLIWGMGGSAKVFTGAGRAASAFVGATSKVAATRIENVVFMELPPSFCRSIETRTKCSALCNPETGCRTCALAFAEAVATVVRNNS